LTLFLFLTAHAQQLWVPEGPRPNTRGQVENIDDGEVVGAADAIAVHPANPDIVFLGTVNGGIWRTNNATAPKPTWTHLTDDQISLSIGSLEFDSTDSTHQTLVAGVGRFSSLSNAGGMRSGLLRTTDGGATWTMIDGDGALRGLNISGVAPRRTVILLAANDADNPNNAGIWRGINSGQVWTKISGHAGSGLPQGASATLAGDPSDPNKIYTNVSGIGLYRSDNVGAKWTKISNPAMDAFIGSADNIKISVGKHSNVFAAIDVNGHLAGVFRSDNSGSTWAPMDLPRTMEGGAHAGGQGSIHLSIAADPLNDNIVYIGGDRQPAQFIDGQETNPAIWPNSIGARDYSGRLFRGDASKSPGSQWTHLTHSSGLGVPGGGTAHSSAPHADSRAMAFSPDGTLLEADDGGIYKRTNPQSNQGDWFSMNGNLQTTELHSVSWDANSHIAVGGAQDTGTPDQPSLSGERWNSISTGDGGVVAVDVTTAPGFSIIYSSYYDLFDFRRGTYDSHGTLINEVHPPLDRSDGTPFPAQFYTPIQLNSVDPLRLIIGGNDAVYESLNQGDTATAIAPIIVNSSAPPDTAHFGMNPITYGAVGNPDALYVVSGNKVFVRSSAPPSPLKPSSYSGATVRGVVMDPKNWKAAYVVNATKVLQTKDGGGSWQDITGNLLSMIHGELRSITFSTETADGKLAVGTDSGAYTASGPSFSSWQPLGKGLPNAPVYHIEYSQTDRLYLVGTLGRGAWTLRLSNAPPENASNGMDLKAGSASGPPARLVTVAKTAAEHGDGQPFFLMQGPGAGTPFELSPGLIIDPTRNRIFVMKPEGTVGALDLTNGQAMWNNQDAAKPIGVAGNQVIAQAESHDLSKFNLIQLDAEKGTKVAEKHFAMPAGVFASVTQTLYGNFNARASRSDGGTIISWQFSRTPPRGLAPNTKPNLSPKAIAPPPPLVPPGEKKRGGFRIDSATGAVKEIPATSVPASSGLQGVSQEPGKTQFLSRDGRYLAISERTGNDPQLNKYTVKVYDSQNKAKVAEFPSHLAIVPFAVVGKQLVYEQSPYYQRTDGGQIEVPRTVKVLDLSSGKELWNTPVRDITYRGPFPP
jgi:photosystem II stability/assembly factor-like uncharacterized protein